MSNRETYPASQSPLTGDISGPAGATSITVVGLQNNPVAPINPTQAEVLTWESDVDSPTGEWQPKLPLNAVLLGGTPDGQGVLQGFVIASADLTFLVNNVGMEVLVDWAFGFAFQVFLNGTGIV